MFIILLWHFEICDGRLIVVLLVLEVVKSKSECDVGGGSSDVAFLFLCWCVRSLIDVCCWWWDCMFFSAADWLLHYFLRLLLSPISRFYLQHYTVHFQPCDPHTTSCFELLLFKVFRAGWLSQPPATKKLIILWHVALMPPPHKRARTSDNIAGSCPQLLSSDSRAARG